MKAKYVARDQYGEFYTCGRHGDDKVRDLRPEEKPYLNDSGHLVGSERDCLRCLGE